MESIAVFFSIKQLCIMCTSKCSGSCTSLLKVNPIDSLEALKKLNNLLNNITVCGASNDTDKTLFMSEAITLKTEARKLLDEVNYNGERSPNGNTISTSSYGYHNIFEDNSFKERLNNLKQRIHALSAQMIAVK